MNFKFEGIWNGMYSYNSKDYVEIKIKNGSTHEPIFKKISLDEFSTEEPFPNNVPFCLTVKKGWFNKFSGTVKDESNSSYLKYPAKIRGRQYDTAIRFTKIYPLGDEREQSLKYECLPDGTKCSLEYYNPRVFYHGFILGKNEIKGTWMILPIEYNIKGVQVVGKEILGEFYMFRSGTNAETEHPIYKEDSLSETLAATIALSSNK